MIDDAIDELVGAAADFRDREDYDGAFALLARALTIDPDRLELHIDVAELEAASGRIEMAVGRLENLARAYEQSSQYEDAAAIHEVIEAWLSEGDEPAAEQATPPAPPPAPERIQPMELRTLVAEAVPIHVLRGNTQRAYVAPLAAEPPPLPEARPVQQLLVRTELPGSPQPAKSAVTESVLLRKAPPPPPPPRPVRTVVPTHATEEHTEPHPAPIATAERATTKPRRGPRRDSIAPRWRPSTVQAMPEIPSQKLRATPPEPPKKKARKSIIEPAPSPKRGAIKLDKLPALKGPVPARKRSAGIPRRTPSQHTALLHPHLPSSKKEAQQAPVVAKVQFKKKVVAVAARPKAARPKAPLPESPRPQPQQPPRRRKSTLADRLRQASAGPSVPVAIEIDDEPTRLWAPDHLLL
jgi:hypothetical protein